MFRTVLVPNTNAPRKKSYESGSLMEHVDQDDNIKMKHIKNTSASLLVARLRDFFDSIQRARPSRNKAASRQVPMRQ
jgi:hypothetical protein